MNEIVIPLTLATVYLAGLVPAIWLYIKYQETYDESGTDKLVLGSMVVLWPLSSVLVTLDWLSRR